MSIWKKIKHQDDVELSEDGKTLEVFYYSDLSGNWYIEIPVEFVKKALTPENQEQDANDHESKGEGTPKG